MKIALACCCFGIGFSTNPGSSRTYSQPPNVILFQCDEMDGRVLDPRHPLSQVTHMPHLEAMSKSGVNFVNAYCNSPLCAPSRASMFTGRRTSSLKAWSNVKSLTSDVQESPPVKPDPQCAKVVGYGAQECLRMGQEQHVKSTINFAFESLGYNVTLIGKMDTGGGMKMAPLHQNNAGGYHDSGIWETKHVNAQTYLPGDVLHSWAQGANISKAQFVPLNGPNKWIDTSNFTSFWPSDEKTVDECAEIIHNWRLGDPPFFLYCSIANPHPPYTSNRSWEAFVNKTELIKSVATTAQTYVPPAQIHPADLYSTITEGVPLDFNWTLAEEVALAYHGQCAAVDSLVGVVVEALRNSQALSNTYMIFTSDHGEMHMEHRLVEKMSMYEGSARVPLIMVGPHVPSGKQVTDPVTLIDLFPTLLDMAHAPHHQFTSLEGHSLASYINLETSQKRAKDRPDFAVVEYFGELVNTPHFMVRSGDFKYITYGPEPPYHNYPPQLFDVRSDPLEIRNLAHRKEWSSTIAQLDLKLRSVVDYPEVCHQQAQENRQHVKRWMAAYPDGYWKKLLSSAYLNFDEIEDFNKFLRWLNASGEFASANSPKYLMQQFV